MEIVTEKIKDYQQHSSKCIVNRSLIDNDRAQIFHNAPKRIILSITAFLLVKHRL